MKYLTIKLLVFSSLLIATGCSYEIESGYCRNEPDKNNVILEFRLKDQDGNDIFDQSINSVEVFVFDDYGRFHKRETVIKSELSEFRGLKMTLDEGDYSVIAWANHEHKSKFSDMIGGKTFIDDCSMSIDATDNCEQLFYAPAKKNKKDSKVEERKPLLISAPDKGSVTETLDFEHSHKIISLFVKDYQENGLAVLPDIQLTGLWNSFDMLMHPIKGTHLKLLQPTELVGTPDGDMAHVRFVVSTFDYDNDIKIQLKTPTRSSGFSFVLNDYIDPDKIDLNVEIVIPIVINYLWNGSVNIYIPEWGEEGIIPKPL